MTDPILNVRVESAEDKGRSARYRTKTRSFGASLVAFSVVSTSLWDSADTDPLRPAFALFATSRAECEAFVANLKSGRKLRVDGLGYGQAGHPMEFLKSVGYTTSVQHVPEVRDPDGKILRAGGSLIEVFLRDLYEFIPGMNQDTVTFLLSTPLARLQREAATLPAPGLERLVARFPRAKDRYGSDRDDFDLATVVAEGRRFAAGLDRRTLLPLLPDPLFGVQILLSALRLGHAHRSAERAGSYSPSDRGLFHEVGMARAKRAPGLAFHLHQGSIATWLADEVEKFGEFADVAKEASLLAEIGAFEAGLYGKGGAATKRSRAFKVVYQKARETMSGRDAFDLAKRAADNPGEALRALR